MEELNNVKSYIKVLKLKFGVCKEERENIFIIYNKSSMNIRKRKRNINKINYINYIYNIIISFIYLIFNIISYIPLKYINKKKIDKEYIELNNIIKTYYDNKYFNLLYSKYIGRCIIASEELFNMESRFNKFNKFSVISFTILYLLYNYINMNLYLFLISINVTIFLYYNILYILYIACLGDIIPGYKMLEHNVKIIEHNIYNLM